MSPLIEFTDKGLFCRKGNFYIDPWKPVDFAVITHAHSDHAFYGHKKYLCHEKSKPILQLRLGNNNYHTTEWGKTIYTNGVKISLHPAGHVLGSAQVKVEYNGEVWVFSGDYKTEDDGICESYEPIKCNTFITESTFGLPIYKWKKQAEIYTDIQQWILQNQSNNKTSVLIAYSLGKTQRVLDAVKNVTSKIYVHGAIYNMQQVLLQHQLHDVQVIKVTQDIDKKDFTNGVIIAPPSADGTPWMKKFGDYKLGICSGWMQVRGNVRRKNADKGFVLSDHCDFESLVSSTKATEAEKVFVTHGFQSAFTKYLNETGIHAEEVKTEFGNDEELETPVETTTENSKT